MKEKTRRAYQYLIAQFKEASTWRGIILVATGCGAGISPDLANAIISVGVVAAGLVAVIFPDKIKE